MKLKFIVLIVKHSIRVNNKDFKVPYYSDKNFTVFLYSNLIDICKVMQWCNEFVNRNKEIDKKLDIKNSNNI